MHLMQTAWTWGFWAYALEAGDETSPGCQGNYITETLWGASWAQESLPHTGFSHHWSAGCDWLLGT